ncbi:MAG TPA: DEAD/DEAH box helicase [Polyangia bacterium]|jgi:hypothetical protein
MSSVADIELEFYEQFLIAQGLEPYPVQEQAMNRIFAGESVLVSVPTGTGKTLMAKAGIYKALREGKTAIYTTPLRALTEEKFRELCADFGDEKVGFATGDYKVRPEAPVQVLVAEILWNRIFGDRVHAPADIVIMDEGHYFNDPERGYVWEQSIIGLDPRTQLVILSATVGDADQFCQWVYVTRRVPMALVQSFDRTVPLYHEFKETYLIDLARDLFANGETPAIIFTFGRELCFERARLLKSCRRFTTDEERAKIAAACDAVLLDRGLAPELKPLLLHGIGVHHAGILPRYKQLVERLALERLIKFIVSTETIAAGINLPAKRVVFPELRKYVQKKARLLTSAEYHQMAGRAGRPQFDTEGIAITLAPEEVVRLIREETRDAQKGHFRLDEARLRKSAYARVRSDAQRNNDVSWDPDAHQRLVQGQPAPLRSQTRVTAEQVLAIGLPDLTVEVLPGAALASSPDPGAAGDAAAAPAPAPPPAPATSAADEAMLPASMHLNIVTVIDHLLLDAPKRAAAQKLLAQVTDNLRALGIIDEHGQQQTGAIIGKLRGIDGLFVYYALMHRLLEAEECRALCEFLLDHDAIQRILMRKQLEERRQWVLARWRELRRDDPQLTFEDVDAQYDEQFPRELTPIEVLHNEFLGHLAHPELHGGKHAKAIWAELEDEDLSFMDFVEKHHLVMEEGSLFTYLARVMKIARMLHEATDMPEFQTIEESVRKRLSVVDERVLENLW